MDRNKAIENEIVSRCNMGIITLTILDVITILFFFITLTINVIAIICSLILVVVITFLIVYFKKVKKNPLKYRKYFYNLKSVKNTNYPFEYNHGYDFTSNLFGEKISVRLEGNNISEIYVQKCKDFFNKIDKNERNNLVNLVLNNYKEFKEVAAPVPELPMDDSILKYINPQIMWIYGDKNDNDKVEFLLECVCEWNPEGIEIIVSDYKIKCVRQYTGDLNV